MPEIFHLQCEIRIVNPTMLIAKILPLIFKDERSKLTTQQDRSQEGIFQNIQLFYTFLFAAAKEEDRRREIEASEGQLKEDEICFAG